MIWTSSQWFTAKLRQLHQAKQNAYSKGDNVLYKLAKYTLEKEIRVTKRNYSEKLRIQFTSSDSASVWKGLKEITNCKTPSSSTVENKQLADNLNEFYCRFGKNTRNRLQFAYRAKRSVDDAVNMGLHYVLLHLEKTGMYARILFVDFSSAFKTIIPNLILHKLTQLSVPTSVCQRITSFLTDRQQAGKIHIQHPYDQHWSSSGLCSLSPPLFSLYTNDCTSKDPSVMLLEFAEDTTLIGLIQESDQSAYRQEVKEMAVWCSLKNLEINMLNQLSGSAQLPNLSSEDYGG